MNFLAILQLIMSLLPSGLMLTEDILTFVQSLETAFAGGVPAAAQTAVVTAIAAHLGRTQKAAV